MSKEVTQEIALGFFERLRAQTDQRKARRLEAMRRTRRAALAAGQGQVPLDLTKIAKSLDVHTIRVVPLAMEGRLVEDHAGHSIELNREMSSFRMRFVLAHEIGHLLIGPSTHLSYEEREELCDVCAYELITPADMLYKHINPVFPTLSSLQYVAQVCECPIDTVARAASECGLLGAVSILVFQEKVSGLRICEVIPPLELEGVTRSTAMEIQDSLNISIESITSLRKTYQSPQITSGTLRLLVEEIDFIHQYSAIALDVGRILVLLSRRAELVKIWTQRMGSGA